MHFYQLNSSVKWDLYGKNLLGEGLRVLLRLSGIKLRQRERGRERESTGAYVCCISITSNIVYVPHSIFSAPTSPTCMLCDLIIGKEWNDAMALYELVAPIALQKDLFRVEERLFIKAMNFTAKSLGTTCQAKQMNSPYQTIIRCRVHLVEDYSIWSSLIQVAPVNTGSNQATQCSKLFCPHVPLVILGYN